MATELFPVSESEPRRRGFRLKMWFIGQKQPELFRVEFHCGNPREFSYLQQRAADKDHRFTFREFAQALSLLFLEYRCAGLEGREASFVFPGNRTGSIAASISHTLNREGKIHTLFANFPLAGGEEPYATVVLGEIEQDDELRILVKSDILAADCVEIYWNDTPLNDSTKLRALNIAIREAGGLEPSRQPPPTTKIPQIQKQTELLKEPEPPKVPELKADEPNLSGLLGRAVRALEKIATKPADKPAPEKPQREASQPIRQSEPEKKPSVQAELQPQPEQSRSQAEIPKAELPPFQPIDPKFFAVTPLTTSWPDNLPLIEFPDGDTRHLWTLKHSFEGVLITGRTGSGKSSGSGETFAEAFLRRGFGGLVLTVKEDEAEHWRRLCKRCGRENDLIVVSRGGDWKFNVLAYEAQHPGRGSGLAENLTALCKNLLRISARNQGGGTNEEIWEVAGSQFLNATFELFLLAGGEISFDRLAEFVAAAPTETLPETEADWLKIPVFGSVLLKAKRSLKSPEDKRIFKKATDYWFKYYRTRPPRLRASIILSISAMFDAFRGRDIPALISSETNVTPESIMSGRIVVLDLPIKELQHAGLMLQSVWKYCFQIALERQRRANKPQHRPAFLWEDEAQYFFSNHDHRFQDTARSSRVCRVILTQNLHSFYKELGQGGRDAADTIFGNLNTKVFHNNSDPLSNNWSAEHLGKELKTRVSINHNPPRPNNPGDLTDALMTVWNPPPSAGITTSEQWEYAVQPGEFNKLRTGGEEHDFMVDAYLTWMGLCTKQGRHFIEMSFLQNRNL